MSTIKTAAFRYLYLTEVIMNIKAELKLDFEWSILIMKKLIYMISTLGLAVVLCKEWDFKSHLF